ncbi:hypothetical protein MTBUT4_470010 [Magnetospirillum sp. UT-4]|nr:hypothetical protein MTBUT4_470010 [Magnetospirillum sp. UT-4]
MSTRWPSSRSRASTARSASRAATTPTRNSATPASPATIRWRPPTTRACSRSPSSCRCWPRWPTDGPAGGTGRAGHRRLARYRPRRGEALRRRGRRGGVRRPHPGGAGGAGRRDRRPGRRQGGAVPARSARIRQDRPGGGGAVRAVRAARRAGRQCRRHRRRPGSGGALQAQARGRGLRPQRHRQLAPDPRLRAAAAGLGGRTGDVRHLGCRPGGTALLGHLRRLEGGAGGHGAELGGRGRAYQPAAGQPDRPRRGRHPHARHRLPGRGPDESGAARPGRRHLRRPGGGHLHPPRRDRPHLILERDDIRSAHGVRRPNV